MIALAIVEGRSRLFLQHVSLEEKEAVPLAFDRSVALFFSSFLLLLHFLNQRIKLYHVITLASGVDDIITGYFLFSKKSPSK